HHPRCFDSQGGVEMVSLVKGFAGKATHPLLTGVDLGAYTAGVAMLWQALPDFNRPRWPPPR
ncbi:MAG: hypothetical protein LC644_12730, partial [Pseudonocardia sp.]|nr:hypothetical protein [Pseudonocardia sp.]